MRNNDHDTVHDYAFDEGRGAAGLCIIGAAIVLALCFAWAYGKALLGIT